MRHAVEAHDQECFADSGGDGLEWPVEDEHASPPLFQAHRQR